MKTFTSISLRRATMAFVAIVLASSFAFAGSGDPLKGLNVSKSCSKCKKGTVATTNENGAFRFVEIPKGKHGFEIKLEGTRFEGSYCRVVSSKYTNGSATLTKGSGKPTQELTLIVEIVKPSGKPIIPKPLEYEITADIGNLTCFVQMAGQTPPTYKEREITIVWTEGGPCD